MESWRYWGILILTGPFYEKGITFGELVYIFGRRAIETGFIQTFLLLFSRLQSEDGYNRLLGDIALCFRPLLYGFCLFILFAEKAEQKQSAIADTNDSDGCNDTTGKSAETDETETQTSLADFVRQYGLTRRETEITQLILLGKSNAEIAGELFISETTVKKHVSNIFEKTGVGRREELIIRIRHE